MSILNLVTIKELKEYQLQDGICKGLIFLKEVMTHRNVLLNVSIEYHGIKFDFFSR